ncbi:hypothetical protein ACSFA0_22505 [Variovorax sp. LT1P1]|uniref:hypothetical protein n=1 Tax=Variovorax sp. LT1P1 TaxID=3443730 RepID=UPI003F452C1C
MNYYPVVRYRCRLLIAAGARSLFPTPLTFKGNVMLEPRPLTIATETPAAARTTEGFLCYAWGESDKPIARLLVSRDEVESFIVAEWTGGDGSKGEEGEPCGQTLRTFAAHDWNTESILEFRFERGGLQIEQVYIYAQGHAVGLLSAPLEASMGLWDEPLDVFARRGPAVSGFLCYAWGEADRPIAHLLVSREEIESFIVTEWTGDNDAQCAEAMLAFDLHDWRAQKVLEFTSGVGSVQIEPVYFHRDLGATPHGVDLGQAPTAGSRMDAEMFSHGHAASAAIDSQRLDLVLQAGAFLKWSDRLGPVQQCQLMQKDPNDNDVVLSGNDRFFDTPRDAIDAALRLRTVDRRH